MTGPPTGPPRRAPERGVHEPPEYLAEHVRTALATDPRVHEQGLEVTVVGETIVLRGTVPTRALREAVGVVVHEHAPATRVVNDVEVLPNPEPGPDSSEEID